MPQLRPDAAAAEAARSCRNGRPAEARADGAAAPLSCTPGPNREPPHIRKTDDTRLPPRVMRARTNDNQPCRRVSQERCFRQRLPAAFPILSPARLHARPQPLTHHAAAQMLVPAPASRALLAGSAGPLFSPASLVRARAMGDEDRTLYHLAPLAAWSAAKASGMPYTPATYAQARAVERCLSRAVARSAA
jgi:hypothetical protein